MLVAWLMRRWAGWRRDVDPFACAVDFAFEALDDWRDVFTAAAIGAEEHRDMPDDDLLVPIVVVVLTAGHR